MTRIQLYQNVLAWLHRAKIGGPIPSVDAVSAWIDLAQEQINTKLRARCMVQRLARGLTTQYLDLPDDFLEFDTQGVRLVGYGELLPQGRSFLADLSGIASQNTTGALSTDLPARPTYYALVGCQLEVQPFPPLVSEAWTIEIAYYQQQILGPDDGDTTATLTSYPSVWLYGALMQSAPFLRDDERIAVWAQMFSAGVTAANDAYERAKFSAGRLVQTSRTYGQRRTYG